MIVEFQIFHESSKPSNAERSIARMKDANAANFTIVKTEQYMDKGSVATCQTELPTTSWELVTYNLIRFAQSFAYSWTINGDLTEELELITTNFRAGPGVSFAKIMMNKSN